MLLIRLVGSLMRLKLARWTVRARLCVVRAYRRKG